ncbi:hypothetical protein OG948_38675 (plasmid) [Embleya sp. NBC_00888]|uniref:hypothetical protein n=1 Tax=Embleya sp. NBC_00888 TaxID=2975960 RepID=UPI00386FDFF1|nr:hypothetical protein OG948_38675 [Embleya sp. NBC_00888]
MGSPPLVFAPAGIDRPLTGVEVLDVGESVSGPGVVGVVDLLPLRRSDPGTHLLDVMMRRMHAAMARIAEGLPRHHRRARAAPVVAGIGRAMAGPAGLAGTLREAHHAALATAVAVGAVNPPRPRVHALGIGGDNRPSAYSAIPSRYPSSAEKAAVTVNRSARTSV